MYNILMQRYNNSRKINFYLYILLIFLAVYLFYFLIQHLFINEHMTNISGIVEKGRGMAKVYGYKTANITIDKKLDCGIYNGISQYGKTTIISDGSNKVECHIHDFNKNIYGKNLNIKNIKKLHNRYKNDNDHCNLAKNILQNNL